MNPSTSASESGPKFAVDLPIACRFADARVLGELAREAEDAGWDGFFVMDHLIRRQPWQPMIDPWIAMAVIAAQTDQIMLGPMVTPLPRRRTAIIARQTVTLDRLSEGRLRLGVGLGAPDDEFTRFGESADPKLRAAILDESLELLLQLWSGEPVDYHGEHVMAEGVQFTPRPTNGHIPIWVAGIWPGKAPFRRAARHDGVWPIGKGSRLTPEGFDECVSAVSEYREAADDDLDRSFDYCYSSTSPGPADAETIDTIGMLAASGMTWWIEALDYADAKFEDQRDRILAGPPA